MPKFLQHQILVVDPIEEEEVLLVLAFKDSTQLALGRSPILLMGCIESQQVSFFFSSFSSFSSQLQLILLRHLITFQVLTRVAAHLYDSSQFISLQM